MIREIVIDQLDQFVQPDGGLAIIDLAAQTALAGYDNEDIQHLIEAIDQRVARVVLMRVTDAPHAGQCYWVIERASPRLPPLSWSLAEWRARLHPAGVSPAM